MAQWRAVSAWSVNKMLPEQTNIHRNMFLRVFSIKHLFLNSGPKKWFSSDIKWISGRSGYEVHLQWSGFDCASEGIPLDAAERDKNGYNLVFSSLLDRGVRGQSAVEVSFLTPLRWASVERPTGSSMGETFRFRAEYVAAIASWNTHTHIGFNAFVRTFHWL